MAATTTTTTGSAEHDAQEMLAATWTLPSGEVPLPVDPVDIARRLDIEVYTVVLEQGLSGMLIKERGRNPEIYLNGDDHKNRRRFTCAHELGHYYKRSASRDDEWECIDRRDPLTSLGTDPDERYANAFAANLLMPRPMVTAMAERYGTATLAYRFGVSVDAMNFRLNSLGL